MKTSIEAIHIICVLHYTEHIETVKLFGEPMSKLGAIKNLSSDRFKNLINLKIEVKNNIVEISN